MSGDGLSLGQKLILGALILNIGAYGCVTTWMWTQHPRRNPALVKLQDMSSSRLAIGLLQADQIAVFAIGPEDTLDGGLATVYACDAATLQSIKLKSTHVTIREELSIENNTAVVTAPPSFRVDTADGWHGALRFVKAGWTGRSERQMLFEDKRISFHRVVWREKRRKDISWLWKLPLTPLSLAVDVASIPLAIGFLVGMLLGHGN